MNTLVKKPKEIIYKLSVLLVEGGKAVLKLFLLNNLNTQTSHIDFAYAP